MILLRYPKFRCGNLGHRNFDRSYSLTSLHLPLAALGSLPTCRRKYPAASPAAGCGHPALRYIFGGHPPLAPVPPGVVPREGAAAPSLVVLRDGDFQGEGEIRNPLPLKWCFWVLLPPRAKVPRARRRETCPLTISNTCATMISTRLRPWARVLHNIAGRFDPIPPKGGDSFENYFPCRQLYGYHHYQGKQKPPLCQVTVF